MNNLTPFNDFKNNKSIIKSSLIKEDFAGKGNVSGGADFFEDAKKTFVGGIFDKLNNYVKTKVYKQMLRNLAHRYNQELLAGVLTYAQKKGIVATDKLKLFIKNKETQEFDIEVLVGENNKLIEINKEINYFKDNKKGDSLEDGEYELSIMKKIKVREGKIIEIIEEKKEEETEGQKENTGEFTFKYDNKDIKVFIPEKEIKIDNSIFGYDASGVSGKTLSDGEYYYDDKIITIGEDKIKDIKEKEKSEDSNIYAAFNKENEKIKLKAFKPEKGFKIEELENGYYAINAYSNDENYESGKRDRNKEYIIYIENKSIKSCNDKTSIVSLVNNKIDEIKNLLVDDFKKSKFDNNVNNNEKIIQTYQNKAIEIFKSIHNNVVNILSVISHLSFDKSESEPFKKIEASFSDNAINKTLDSLIKTNNVDVDPTTPDIAKVHFDKLIKIIDTQYKIPVSENKENRTEAANTVIGNVNASLQTNNDYKSINEAFNLFNTKMKKTKLSNDLSTKLNKSYKDINLDTLELSTSNMDKSDIIPHINVSNIVGIQIRAEQLYHNKKEDAKVNANMQRYWESLIQDVKGQYDRYMDIDSVDPIKLRNDLEKIRRGDGSYKNTPKPTFTGANATTIVSPEGSVFEWALNNNEQLKCQKLKTGETLGNNPGDYLLLNINYNNNIFSLLCKVGNFGDKTYLNYKILAIVDILELLKILNDKTVKLDYDKFKKCLYDFNNTATDKIKELVADLKLQRGDYTNSNGNKIYGNFLLSNSPQTNRDPKKIKLSTCHVYIKDDSDLLKDGKVIENENIDKYKDQLDIFIYTNSGLKKLPDGIEITYFDIDFVSLYKIPNTTSLFNTFIKNSTSNKFFNDKISLYFYKNVFLKYGYKIK